MDEQLVAFRDRYAAQRCHRRAERPVRNRQHLKVAVGLTLRGARDAGGYERPSVQSECKTAYFRKLRPAAQRRLIELRLRQRSAVHAAEDGDSAIRTDVGGFSVR